MKKLLIIGLLTISSTLFAQVDYNRWSIEANVGLNKPVKPYTENYFSSNPKKYFNFSTVNHFNFGARYMFTEYFGAKFSFGLDKISDQKDSGSLDFEAEQYNVAIEGVVNLGNLFHLRSITNRFNLLGHAGVQFSQFTPKMGLYKNITEDNGGVLLGVTPQIRITNRIVLTGDFSALSNVRQHYNWDGMSLSDKDNNLSGLMYSTSLGLTFYLGNKNIHADWYSSEVADSKKEVKDDEARNRIAELEKMLNDTDKDGVPDYLDTQNNTPNGLVVDAKGKFIDVNKNGVPDELEDTTLLDSSNTSNTNNLLSGDAMNSLIENGYLNIFFDVNQDAPNKASTPAIFQLIQYLKANPTAKVKLLGFADIRGGENTNKNLSKRRAQFVNTILTENGVTADRIEVVAQGVDKTFTNGVKNLELARRVSVVLEK